MNNKIGVGRIVHYVLDDGFRNHGRHTPAIVVETWGHTEAVEGASALNLQVFLDGSNDHAGGHNVLWKTSVLYSEKHEHGTWHWPERD